MKRVFLRREFGYSTNSVNVTMSVAFSGLTTSCEGGPTSPMQAQEPQVCIAQAATFILLTQRQMRTLAGDLDLDSAEVCRCSPTRNGIFLSELHWKVASKVVDPTIKF
jgi:hypothetical protein